MPDIETEFAIANARIQSNIDWLGLIALLRLDRAVAREEQWHEDRILQREVEAMFA